MVSRVPDTICAIDIRIGLEIEYLPSFRVYYDELKGNEDIDILVLGQHHSEIAERVYLFEREDKSEEWKYLMEGQIAGTESELFGAIRKESFFITA